MERKKPNEPKPAYFMRCYFHLPSIRPEQLTREQRSEYRAMYLTLLKTYGHTPTGRTRARKVIRPMLYGEIGLKVR